MGNRRHIPLSVKEQALALSQSMKATKVAEATGISRRTVNRVSATAKRVGSAVQPKGQVGRHRILNNIHISFLEGLIEQTPDLYIQELQEKLAEAHDIVVSEWTIRETLKRRGFSRKKVSRMAAERSEEKRETYRLNIAENYVAEQLVFVDESAFNRHTTRRSYGWAPFGDRARRHDYFVRGIRYSILPALSMDGILHADIRPAAYNAETFNAFIFQLLDKMNPFPHRNSVIVMDNASIHKSPLLRQMIEARGMKLVFLPPYSPDFNPIEEAFSAIKSLLRAHRDYVQYELTENGMDPFDLLYTAVFTAVTTEKAEGWFRDCGY